MIAVAIVLLALTRAEIIERFRSPVIRQADGLVQVFANCPEDMRRDYQMPIASFASETAKTLYGGLCKKPVRFRKPGIVIHIGDVRTNLAEVVTQVATNDGRVVSRLYVKSPRWVDVDRLRLELVKAFYRSVENRELDDKAAVAVYRRADPAMRVADERQRLEEWLSTGKGDVANDEEALRLMRKIYAPGHASRRDVLIFASRLFLYPPQHDLRFAGRFDKLSFREAISCVGSDPNVRLVAAYKSRELPIFAGGRSEELQKAAEGYRHFLFELAKAERTPDELRAMLDAADTELNVAYEKAE